MQPLLDGKVAIVTGSSSGIGEAIARLFAAEGASVVDQLDAIGRGRRGDRRRRCRTRSTCAADVAQEDQAKALIAGHARALRPARRAGQQRGHHRASSRTTPSTRSPTRTGSASSATNVLGTWYVTRAGGARRSRPAARLDPQHHLGRRCAAPPAARSRTPSRRPRSNHLTKLLANVLGPEIRVNAVAPGLIDTPWTADWDAIRASVRERAPLQRSGTPDDIARAALLLTAQQLLDRRDPARRRRHQPSLSSRDVGAGSMLGCVSV